ncbi:bifunctional 2-polyprenyl-6-hydroxyphenol methylase/3-demethylubiquinol 3-O-methyltransferase UbiG [Lichenicoccus sp.]|uniref:bifunctional 2-polyprenyl-6-hydroxyphenol methylase/3-demethylubiquinol 3-O-methyltransferase UbiG n=1 Tax=Lichenicoccus sp. TaxID=2781899 RepID=UPI003D0DCE8E
MQGNESGATASSVSTSSVRTGEIERFDALAAQWWDPDGPMRMLHRMNPLRIGWIDRRLRRRPDTRLRLLDLGCGAGLASEALAALGHDVLGVDASPEAILAAREHHAAPRLTAPGQGPAGHAGALSYRDGSAEALLREGLRFDAVIALEVIEHVTDPAGFLRLLAGLLQPGGVIVISTLNRTLRSLATAKIGAEYVLRLLPAGTHDWRRFVTPAELGRHAARAGLRVADLSGMVPGLNGWRESHDTAVNYIALLESR